MEWGITGDLAPLWRLVLFAAALLFGEALLVGTALRLRRVLLRCGSIARRARTLTSLRGGGARASLRIRD